MKLIFSEVYSNFKFSTQFKEIPVAYAKSDQYFVGSPEIENPYQGYISLFYPFLASNSKSRYKKLKVNIIAQGQGLTSLAINHRVCSMTMDCYLRLWIIGGTHPKDRMVSTNNTYTINTFLTIYNIAYAV